jgi:transcriptional regulator with XRE-family HTH domain
MSEKENAMTGLHFGANLKFLRKRRKRTQDELAMAMGMKRPTLSGYENGIAQPGLAALVAFSEYFGLPIDALVRTDLSQLGESRLSQLERGGEVYFKGSHLRVLATTVFPDNEENIEMVPEPAKAGYTSGFADPEYIGRLPVFRLPFLSNERKYRSFQISGDSMLPIPDGAWVTGEFVRDWNTLRTGEACIIVTLHDGIVFKLVENQLAEKASLLLRSLNPRYAPFELDGSEVNEVWKFIHFISNELPEADSSQAGIFRLLLEIREVLGRKE